MRRWRRRGRASLRWGPTRRRCRTTTSGPGWTERARSFLEEAPTSAATAATIILDGVKADRWRILVGDDAHKVDEWVRRTPERAYDADAFEELAAEIGWRLGS